MNETKAFIRRSVLEKLLGAYEDWQDWKESESAPRIAQDLLAAWGAFCRVYRTSERNEVAGSVQKLLEDEGPALVAAAAKGPFLEHWIEDVRHMDQAWNFALDQETQRELEMAAGRLFEEFDRASLLVCFAGRPGVQLPSEGLDSWKKQVEEVDEAFSDHVEAFLPAATLASAQLDAFRPDLDEEEDLWETTLKHQFLEEVSEELTSEDAVAVFSDRGQSAVEKRPLPTTPPSPTSWFDIPELAMAAQEERGYEPFEVRSWRSPEGKFEARLVVSRESTETVRVNFYADEDESAVELAGLPVSLAEVPGMNNGAIDSQGHADFPLEALRQARKEQKVLRLLVDWVEWVSVEE